MERKEIKLWAKEKTRNNKWNVWKGYLIVWAIAFLVAFAVSLVSITLYGLTNAGYETSLTISDVLLLVVMAGMYIFISGLETSTYRYLNGIVEYDEADLNSLKATPKQYFKQGLGILLMSLAVMLGMIALIIPGFILFLGLNMVPYLLANHQEMKIFEAMKTSWQMMKGHKLEILIMFLSFYGWMVLSVLTLGLLYIWLLPYMNLTFIKYFREIAKAYYGIDDSETTENNDDIQEFAMLNNLKIDHHNVYGMFNDYPTVIMFDKTASDLMITINVVGENQGALDEYFSNIKTILTNLKEINYGEGVLTLRVRRCEELHELYEIINRITLKLRDLGYLASCGVCHLNKPSSFYKYHGQIVNLCDDCKNETFIQDAVDENTSKGLIGALLGAMLGGIVWAIVYQLGFIAAIVGYLIVFLAVCGYTKMAGKISKKGLVISIVCSVLVLFLAEYACLGIEIMKLVSYNNFFNALSLVPYFLSFSEVVAVVIKDLIIGLLFMGIASFQYVYKINKAIDEQSAKQLD